MLVDLSHVSDKTMKDAIEVSKAPVIFSHSSVRSLCNHVRNVPDDVLVMLPGKDGVVMINFYPDFVKEEARLEALRLSNEGESTPESVDTMMVEFQKNSPYRSTVSDVADHIDYIKNLIGWQYAGIGADFDGIPYTTDGLADVSDYPNLVVELFRRNYTDKEVRGIIGENILRVMTKADQVAAVLQKTYDP